MFKMRIMHSEYRLLSMHFFSFSQQEVKSETLSFNVQTDGHPMCLQWSPDGQVLTVYESAHPEFIVFSLLRSLFGPSGQ
jgi:hypothetical protein